MIDEAITYPTAFIAGMLSFFSPCIVPLVPAYFTFITGFSLDKLTHEPTADTRARVVLSTSAFILGFTLVFILLGATASALGTIATRYHHAIRIAGGVVIFVLGAHMAGLWRIPILEMDRRIHFHRKPVHFLGTFLVGMAFGAGWSPCIGPLLGSILILASSSETVAEGMLLLTIYSAGLGIPFLLISVFIHYVLKTLNRMRRFVRYINVAAGIFLMAIGLLLILNRFGLIWNALSIGSS
ncbi:MAG: cytochrome c biogenesis CcdA family protein [Desulfobacterales bacterium]